MNTRNANTTNLTAAQTELPQNQFKLQGASLVGLSLFGLSAIGADVSAASRIIVASATRSDGRSRISLLPSCDDPDPPLSQSRQRNDENTTCRTPWMLESGCASSETAKGERREQKDKVRWFDISLSTFEVIVRCTSWF